ncbi:hypothetical protein GM535_13500, partial [Streptococcus pneumoniae]|nr:hypothetical protein [Streptococcus pneumoniae]
MRNEAGNAGGGGGDGGGHRSLGDGAHRRGAAGATRGVGGVGADDVCDGWNAG